MKRILRSDQYAGSLGVSGDKVEGVHSSVDDLSYFVGCWWMIGHDEVRGVDFTTLYSVSPILNGRWLLGSSDADREMGGVKHLLGRDTHSGEFLRMVFTSGGNYRMSTSKGWIGNTLRFEGESGGKGKLFPVRQIVRRKGPDEFDESWEALRGGDWVPYAYCRFTRHVPR